MMRVVYVPAVLTIVSFLSTTSTVASDSKQAPVSKLATPDAAPWNESITPDTGESSKETISFVSDAPESSTSGSDEEERRLPYIIDTVEKGNMELKNPFNRKEYSEESMLVPLTHHVEESELLPPKPKDPIRLRNPFKLVLLQWWWYNCLVPTHVFRKFGLSGKGSNAVKDSNYKYYRKYAEKWAAEQSPDFRAAMKQEREARKAYRKAKKAYKQAKKQNKPNFRGTSVNENLTF